MSNRTQIKIWGAFALIILMVTVAMPLAAAGGGSEAHAASGYPWISWLTSLVNFAIFAGIIVYFLGPTLQEFFEERRQELVEEIEKAETYKERAENKLEEYEQLLDSIEQEREEILAEYHERGQREKERLIEEGKKQIEQMRAEAERTIDQEVKKAIESLENKTVTMAVEMAEKMVRERMDESQQQALIQNYVETLNNRSKQTQSEDRVA